MRKAIRKTFKSLMNYLVSAGGWKSQEKIIVFESDDWGSIRMPSPECFNKLEKAGLDLRSADAERYNLNDSLATSHDLERLFEVLSGTKDRYGSSAVFTPVTIVANPDFKKIADSGFTKYLYEPFSETLKRTNGCEKSFELWKEGIKERLFVPQMHGREHLNVFQWIKALSSGDQQAMLAFREGFWGFVPRKYPRVDYQAAFLFETQEELKYQEQIIIDGLNLFKFLFGYKADYFVPPNGVFNNTLNKTLSVNGIKYRYASLIQNEPVGQGRMRKLYHWPGKVDKNGLLYIVRNCFFEPSLTGTNWIDNCLHDIGFSFKYNMPAIIGTHRVNYISSLNPSNGAMGLMQLKKLLTSIVKNWPDVSFMTTTDLASHIIRKQHE